MGKQQYQSLPPAVDVDLLDSIFAGMSGQQSSGRMIEMEPAPGSSDAMTDDGMMQAIKRRLFDRVMQGPDEGAPELPASILGKMGPDMSPAARYKLDAIARQKERLGGRREYLGDILSSIGNQSDNPIEAFATSFQRARKNRILREDALGELDMKEAEIRGELESDRLLKAYWGDPNNPYTKGSGNLEYNKMLLNMMNSFSLQPGREANAGIAQKKLGYYDADQQRKENESASRIENMNADNARTDTKLGMEQELQPGKVANQQSLIDSRKAGERAAVTSQKFRALENEMEATQKSLDRAYKAREAAYKEGDIKKANKEIKTANENIAKIRNKMRDIGADLEIDGMGLSDEDRADLDQGAQMLVDGGKFPDIQSARKYLLEQGQ